RGMLPRLPIPVSAKGGQTLIFMSMIILMIAFAALFYFDVHKTLHVKAKSRNAGDAAALSAARWQAVSLNLIGSLNIASAVAITNDLSAGRSISPEAELIADLQHRISFSGPLLAYVSAQQAAKQNGMFNNPDFASTMNGEISEFESLLIDNPPEFTPSGFYNDSTQELLAMMELIPSQGMAVRAPAQYPPLPNHLLLNPSFYDAIAGRSWCWFYYNARSELQNYDSYQEWDLEPSDILQIFSNLPIRTNSPYFTLWLNWVIVRDRIPVLPIGSTWEDTMQDLQSAFDDLRSRNAEAYADFDTEWALYNQSRWLSWSGRLHPDFPWDSEIRPEYDYGGADAALLLLPEITRRSEFSRNENSKRAQEIERTAAAKIFGTLEGEDGEVPPNNYGLVLPAYTDVRLIPMGASLSGGNNQMRPGWIDFVRNILPDYLEFGPDILDDRNYYSNQLIQWERREFRMEGLEWLQEFSGSCYQPSPGGGGGGSGGTSFGH
ncbi:MAG: hypothetical protein ACO3NW_06350, partial [Kiritimatiellia bacterium]